MCLSSYGGEQASRKSRARFHSYKTNSPGSILFSMRQGRGSCMLHPGEKENRLPAKHRMQKARTQRGNDTALVVARSSRQRTANRTPFDPRSWRLPGSNVDISEIAKLVESKLVTAEFFKVVQGTKEPRGRGHRVACPSFVPAELPGVFPFAPRLLMLASAAGQVQREA